MVVRFKLSALKDSPWSELMLRFFLGGLATVVAGVAGNVWGPVVGGLFLAVPAIFFASATHIESHERERKEKKGLKAGNRGKTPRRSTPPAQALEAPGSPRLARSCGFSRKRPPLGRSPFPQSCGSPSRRYCGGCGVRRGSSGGDAGHPAFRAKSLAWPVGSAGRRLAARRQPRQALSIGQGTEPAAGSSEMMGG
jgi:hypothetical protein